MAALQKFARPASRRSDCPLFPATVPSVADLGAIASAATAALIGYSAWRDLLRPWLQRRERRQSPDSERHADVEQAVGQAVDHTKLRSDVDNLAQMVAELRGAHERFAREVSDRWQHFASADALATHTSTTTATLIQLTEKVAEVKGMVGALQPSGPRGRY